MTTRMDYLRKINAAIRQPASRQDSQNAIQGLLMTAATLANSLSQNSTRFSKPHVEESVTEMVAILESTFDIEVL